MVYPKGKGSLTDGIEMNELYGGARISYIFTEIFGRSLQVGTLETFAIEKFKN